MASEKDIYAEIGRRIRQIREKQGITQHELALRCDILQYVPNRIGQHQPYR